MPKTQAGPGDFPGLILKSLTGLTSILSVYMFDITYICNINYEAASRGNIGAKVAELLGDAKEDYWDYYDNQIRKKKTAQEAILDKMHDKQVNETGRQRAASGLYSNSCEACHSYRVKGINDKY